MNARCGRLAIVLCLVGGACTTSESGDSLYAQATSALRRGELERAAETAARAADNQTDAPEARLAVDVRLLRAEIALAQGRPGDAADFAQPTVPEALAETIVEARHSKVLAQIDLASRRIAEAAGRLERAEILARRYDDGALLREVLLLDGLRLSASGDPRARVRTEEAYQNAIAAGDAYWQAAALNNLALFRFRAFLYDEALTLFQQALDAARQVGAQRFAAASLTNIGPCYYRLGDLTRARTALEEAARIQEEIGARGNLQASLGELGNLAVFEEDAEQATRHYRRAIDLARQHAPADAARWETNLAAVLLKTGAWDEAARLNSQAASAGQAAGDASLVGYRRLYAGIIALHQGQVAEAERMLTDTAAGAGANLDLAWEATAELGAAAAARGDRATAAKRFEAALAGIETTRAGLRRDHQVTFLEPRRRFYRRYVEWLIDQGQPDRALDVVESSRVQLLASRFGRAVEHARGTGADSLRRIARRERASLLSYWITPNRSFVWVITPERVELVALAAPEAEIARLVQAYRTFVETGLRDPLATGFPPAQDLYRLLVAPIVPHLNGASRVIVAPDGPLHALPFDALVVPGDQPRYWIEDVTLMTAPSLAVLTTAPPRPVAASALLAFGAPEPDAAGLPPLPHASEELSQLAARLPNVKVIAGRDATPEAFAAADPARFARIHFASHAIANPVSPLDSAIMTAPSQAGGTRLLARTLLETPLSADLVTISACRGAGARVIAGEGLVGFAWVLLHAGARHVIAGLWDVNDRSTLDLMTALYTNLGSQPAPAEALRAAKLHLLAPGSRFRHPFYWAPFTVFIGPGPSRAPTAQTPR
jgi:CHAT domain-containing protein/tetratricopeptide (TPR) repeat protein